MSMDDNPFAAGGATFGRSAGGDDGGSMEPVPMEVGPILTRCWELLASNPGIVIAAVIIPAIPAVVIGFMDAGLQIAGENDYEMATTYSMASLGLNIVNMLIGVFFQLGVVRIFLNLARGSDTDVGMLMSGGPLYLSGLVATFLMGIGVTIGFILLIIPGVILALGLQFTMYALVDRGLGPIEALSESWRVTDGHKMTIFLINLVIGLLAIFFTCATLGFGYFLIVPLLALTQAVMYHSLTAGGYGSSDVSLAGLRG